MFETIKPLVLASASPRRNRFFAELGLEFSSCPAELDESLFPDEKPSDYVKRITRAKARQVAGQFSSSWVVSADTIVVLDDTVLGKPADIEEALTLLMLLSGKIHRVTTAYCLMNLDKDICEIESVSTLVRFTSFDEKLARAYACTGEPLDKAGAYGIQGKGGLLVASIEGSYTNVVGLPLTEVISLLLRYNIIAVK